MNYYISAKIFRPSVNDQNKPHSTKQKALVLIASNTFDAIVVKNNLAASSVPYEEITINNKKVLDDSEFEIQYGNESTHPVYFALFRN